jgi:hypothetical protein
MSEPPSFNKMLQLAYVEGFNKGTDLERPRAPQQLIDAWLNREFRIWVRKQVNELNKPFDP